MKAIKIIFSIIGVLASIFSSIGMITVLQRNYSEAEMEHYAMIVLIVNIFFFAFAVVTLFLTLAKKGEG